jgi:hypothetical protein
MVTPDEITWEVLKAALPEIDKIRKHVTPEAREADKNALRAYLCDYFNSDEGTRCEQKQGKGISPVGFPTGAGGKCLKVRWLIPGQGKSGGLRLAVVEDEPADADFAEAVAKA